MELPSGENYLRIKEIVKDLKLSTVCQEAQCPNLGQCWNGGTATFMLMGETCTRGCRFCHVKSGHPGGVLDAKEPEKVLYAVTHMKLDYVVLTSVDRDDLLDQGASHFAETIRVLRSSLPKLFVEVLTPDFSGMLEQIELVIQARPHVFGHNLETVERLTPRVRDRRATYRQSLRVLEMAKSISGSHLTKSSLMLGLGETENEVIQSLKDLRSVGCDLLTLGQYLQPSSKQLPVVEFVSPEKFKEWEKIGESMGFRYVASGPMVRSSYRAGEHFVRLKSRELTEKNLSEYSATHHEYSNECSSGYANECSHE